MILFVVVFAAAAATAMRIGMPVVLTYPQLRVDAAAAGFDQRFLNKTDPPLDVANFRRLLEVQKCLRILENPDLNIDARAKVAEDWLQLHRVQAPQFSAQLWEDWLADGFD
jgi:hypothetical protein